MKTHKESVMFRIAADLRRLIEMIVYQQRRSFSNQINVALEK